MTDNLVFSTLAKYNIAILDRNY